MTVGDLVVALDAVGDFNGGAALALQGLVNAEAGGPPATADVLWNTGQLASAVPQARLGKVFDATDAGIALIGKWIQMIAYGAAASGAPKNAAFSGIVVSAFRVAAYGAPDPGAANNQIAFVEGATGRILVFEDDQTNGPQYVVAEGRRSI